MSKSQRQSVLVTGANGFVGNSIARAFVRAGWTTYGLIRDSKHVSSLALEEIIPIIGSPSDLSFIESKASDLQELDVVVSTTEQLFGYSAHFNDIATMLQRLSTTSTKRLLVLFSSGSKDYGPTSTQGNSEMVPFIESSPPNPPPLLNDRTTCSLTLFDRTAEYDAVILRPTHLYGYSSSWFSFFFDMAEKAKATDSALEIPARPENILHSIHVDDCAEAYVAIASAKDRSAVAGQVYNISSSRYETIGEIADALVKEYGIQRGAKFIPGEKWKDGLEVMNMVVNFPQWLSSDKLRTQFGWTDKKPMFTEKIYQYRNAYDAVVQAGKYVMAKDPVYRNVQLPS